MSSSMLSFIAPTAFRPSYTVTIHRSKLRRPSPRKSFAYNKRPCRPNTILHMQAANSPDDETFSQLADDIRLYMESIEQTEPAPLAYDTLRRAGRIDLISRIMDAGGYIQVSERLEIPVDESRFTPSPPKERKPLFSKSDNTASLAVGRTREARLEAINNDTDALSAETKNNEQSSVTSKYSAAVPSAEQLRLDNEAMVPPIVDKPVPEGELFSLTASMRIGMLLLVSLTAIAFGRASVGLVSPEVMQACQGLVFGLSFAHIIIAIYAGSVEAPKLNRNAALWSFKVLLSGPLGLATLRALPVLED